MIHKSNTSRVWTIHESNPEQLRTFKTWAGSMSRVNKMGERKWTKRLEHLPVFKALRIDDPQVEHLLRVDYPRVQSGTITRF